MSSPERGRAPFGLRNWFPSLRRREPPGHFERAVAHLDRGRCLEALRELELAFGECSGEPARAIVHNKRGVALLGLGRRDEALEAFCAALTLDERSAPVLVNLGNLFFESDHLDDAVDYYQAALRADEKYGLAHANLAAVYKRRGDRSAAVRALRAAAKLAVRRSPGRA